MKNNCAVDEERPAGVDEDLRLTPQKRKKIQSTPAFLIEMGALAVYDIGSEARFSIRCGKEIPTLQ